MYPKKFTLDPDIVARARLVTLKAPNLDVLLPENRAEMPGIAKFLEDGFKARHREGKLLLPDLSALSNTTVGIFSDCGIRRDPATHSDLIPATDSDSNPATCSDPFPATYSDRDPATPEVVVGFAVRV